MSGGLARFGTRLAAVALTVLAAVCVPAARAERAEPLPGELEGVGVTERLGQQLPLDLPFTDEDGRPVKLGNYFQAGRPVLLDLGYYRCPMLCNLVLNGFIEGLREVPNWTPGDNFEVVVVSVDPLETAKLAKLKKQNYVREYGRPESAGGWHFLTGTPESIAALTEAVGFRYKWVEERNEYAHAAVLVTLTPTGRVARYLYGVVFEPRTIRLTLAEASEGRSVSALDQLMLYCFQYDPSSRSYSLAAINIMRAGGVLALIVVGAVLASFWMRESRRRRAATVTAEGHP
ncbi:MAG: SCO family protein [Acidobacteria bacterium]|nr:SCO family protein [Acidobacteriota bacterium]